MEERFEAFLRVEDRGSHVSGDRKVLEYDWFPVGNQERNIWFSGCRFYQQMCVLIFYNCNRHGESAFVKKRVILACSIRSYSLRPGKPTAFEDWNKAHWTGISGITSRTWKRKKNGLWPHKLLEGHGLKI